MNEIARTIITEIDYLTPYHNLNEERTFKQLKYQLDFYNTILDEVDHLLDVFRRLHDATKQGRVVDRWLATLPDVFEDFGTPEITTLRDEPQE